MDVVDDVDRVDDEDCIGSGLRVRTEWTSASVVDFVDEKHWRWLSIVFLYSICRK